MAVVVLDGVDKGRLHLDDVAAVRQNDCGLACQTAGLIADQTGTGSTRKGVTSATNDAGILMALDASSFVVVVLIADFKGVGSRSDRIYRQGGQSGWRMQPVSVTRISPQRHKVH